MEGFFNSEKALVGKVEKRIKAKTKGKLYHLANKGYPAMVDGEDTGVDRGTGNLSTLE